MSWSTIDTLAVTRCRRPFGVTHIAPTTVVLKQAVQQRDDIGGSRQIIPLKSNSGLGMITIGIGKMLRRSLTAI